jgi:hypothetical protein
VPFNPARDVANDVTGLLSQFTFEELEMALEIMDPKSVATLRRFLFPTQETDK